MSRSELNVGTQKMIRKGYAEGTNENHCSAWKDFVRVCELYGWQSFPASEQTLCNYTYHVFESTSIQGSTMDNRLDGIRATHVKMGYKLVIKFDAMPQLGLQRRTFRKERPEKQKEKRALTADIMEQLLQRLNGAKRDQQMMRALLAFAYGGMLRVSEYAYGKGTVNKPRVRNITEMSNERLVYQFNHSKTNQTKRAERVVMCCRCPRICAVHEVAAMLSMRRNKSRGEPLFQMSDGHCPTIEDVNSIVKKLAAECGIPREEVSSHGMRAGAITDALAAGIADSVVQVMSRHKSADSMAPYKKFTSAMLGGIMQRAYRKENKRARRARKARKAKGGY